MRTTPTLIATTWTVTLRPGSTIFSWRRRERTSMADPFRTTEANLGRERSERLAVFSTGAAPLGPPVPEQAFQPVRFARLDEVVVNPGLAGAGGVLLPAVAGQRHQQDVRE